MKSKSLSLLITIASLSALCGPALAAKTPVPGKTEVSTSKAAPVKSATPHKLAPKKAIQPACVKKSK